MNASPLLLAAEGPPLDVPAWSVTPFALLLLAIAVLPLVAGHWWHQNRNKALISALLALPVAGYLLWLGPRTEGTSVAALLAEVAEYASFIALLGSLYVVSGGIRVAGGLRPTPVTNAALLAFGAVLANFIGTTGASMVLIRPALAMNRPRQHTRHLPVFFIFLVSNVGGLLTPLGDPPLFLGLLKGVGFFWPLRLWPHWLVVNGSVLAIFLTWDTLAYRREGEAVRDGKATPGELLRVTGLVNVALLAVILAAVLFQSPQVGDRAGAWLSRVFPCPSLTLTKPWGEVLMAVAALLSLCLTPRGTRSANGFTWGPILEVAVLFAGIFVAMVPALELLRGRVPEWGLNQLAPWQYFWLTGGLSGFLDNAPTYLAISTVAAAPENLVWLAANRPEVLEAISCGAVFLGAMTYIGNGPNFMVKAIAEEAGYGPPSFFGYLLYSSLVLGPVFVLVALLFF